MTIIESVCVSVIKKEGIIRFSSLDVRANPKKGKMKKRFICLVLAMLSIVSLAACGNKTDGTENTTTVITNADITTSGENETTGLVSGLPEADFGGQTFTMLCREARAPQFFSEDQNGSLLNDAVFTRNEKVETEYGVKLAFVTCPDGASNAKGVEFNSKLAADFQSGDAVYDVVAPDYYWGCETKGYFTNLLELDYLSFDKPWWWKGWNDCFTIGGRLSSAVGWFTLDIVQGMEVVYFNKDMMVDLSLDEPYKLVYDKAWTIDKMIEMSKTATSNVGPNGVLNQNDYCYGTILHYMGAWSMMFGLGAKIAEYDNDGNVSLNLGTEKNEDVVTKLTDWIHSGDANVFYASNEAFGHNMGNNERPVDTANMFAEEHSLFYCYGIKAAELLATMDVPFGILPPPLADEEQEKYITTTFGTSYFAIESNLSKDRQNFAAFILEALNFYSYTMVKDVYYENNLKLRYASDPQTSDMLDYVVESAYIDFAHITDNYTGGLRSKMLSCIINKTSVASAWRTAQKLAKKNLSDYIEGYLK